MRVPLHIKLMASYGLVVGLVVGPSFVYLHTTLQGALRGVVQRDLERETALVSDRLAAAPTGDTARVLAPLQAVLPERITVIAPDGRVLADSARSAEGMENHGARPEVREALDLNRTGAATRRSATTGQNLLYVAMRYPRSGPPRGVVRLARPLADIDAASAGALRFVNHTGAVALSAAVLLSLIAAVAASRPLRRIAAAVRAFESGDFGHPIEIRSDDEIGDTARSLTQLAARLRDKLLTIGADRATLQAILDELPVGVIVYDTLHSVVTLNGAARSLCALRPEHESERAGWIARHDDHAAAIARVLATGTSEDLPLALPWLPGVSLTARWVAVFTAAGERLPALVILDHAPGAQTAALARCAAVLRASTAGLSVAARRRVLDAADEADLLAGELPAGTPVAVTAAALWDAAHTEVLPDAEASGVTMDLPQDDPGAMVADTAGRAGLAVRRLLAAAVSVAERGGTVRLRTELTERSVRFSARAPGRRAAGGELVRYVSPLGGEAGESADGSVTETWIALPRA